jgi:hypothetical protein
MMMNKLINKSRKSTFLPQAFRCFSGFQKDMEAFDFSDKLNIEDLGLKFPDQKEKMNLCATITNTLDIAM